MTAAPLSDPGGDAAGRFVDPSPDRVTDPAADRAVEPASGQLASPALGAARSLLRVCLLGGGVLLILLAVLTLGARLALPFVEGYKGEIETRLGDYLERPVAIGKLDLRWRARGPQLRLLDVSVFESETRGVTFEELLVDVDLLSSALRGTPIIGELTLVGAELVIEYAGAGDFRLHGVERRSGRAASGDATDGATDEATAGVSAGDGLDLLGWLLDARKVGLLDAHLTVLDARSGRRLVVDALNVRAENDGVLHRLRVELALPPELGGTLEAGIDFDGTSGRLEASDGSVYARGSNLRLAAWRELRDGVAGGSEAVSGHSTSASSEAVAPDPAAASRPAREVAGVTEALLDAVQRLDADAQIELWGRWQSGELQHARARVDLRALSLAGEPLLDTLSADLAYRDERPGWTLQADRVELVAGGERAVLEQVELGRGARSAPRWHVSGGGTRLPLALAARLPRALSAALPMPAARALVALRPGGALGDWQASIELVEARPRVTFSADLEALSLAPSPHWPGIDALDGALRIDDNRGTLTLAGTDTALVRGAAALELDALELALELDARIPGQTRIDGRTEFRQASVEANARFGITLAAGRSPHVDAQGRYTVGNLADVPYWLPIVGAPEAVSSWFRRAVIGGRASAGDFVWVGQLADFPHTDGPGELRSGFDLVGGELDFLPDWPRARLPSARVELDGMTFVARTTEGGLDSLDVTRAVVRIEELRRPRLELEASGRAALQSLVTFANTGPLARILEPVLGHASGTGRAGLDIALSVPLGQRSDDGEALELDGSLFLEDNDLTFGRADLTFRKARGAVGFDAAGVRIGNLRATLFGRPVSIDGATSGRGAKAMTELTLGGALEAADVLAHYGIPLDRFVRGASRWDIALSAPHSAALIRRDGVRLLATSDLVGTELRLPAPLDKPSARALPLTLSTAFREGEGRTRWRIEHGSRLRAALDVDADGLYALGARFGQGAAIPPAERGIRLDGHAPSLAMDGWATALATLIEDLPPAPGGPVPILPIAARISTDALLAGERSLGAATLQLSSDATYLNALLDNAHLAGSVRWPREHWRRERAARVRLRHVDREFVDALASAPETGRATDALDPRELPAIEAHVSSLSWGALALSELTFVARPDPLGLSFVTRTVLTDGVTLSGRGSWRLRDDVSDASRPDGHTSKLALALEGENLGSGLAAAGLPGVLAEGNGSVRTELLWSGPLYLPELERLAGSVALDVERGRILAVEPGPARLVGLFALQAIPRRLDFDFSDVTSDGLAFERVEGDITLAEGMANVALVQLRGPVGVIDIDGTSNLVTREYDQRVTVLPRVSAALPIIGMISGGVSGGIGVLVAGGFLKALGVDFDRLGLRRYALSGSWSEPVFAPLDERHPFQP